MEKEVLEACPKCGSSAVLYREGDEYFVGCAECWRRSEPSPSIIGAIDNWNWEKEASNA